MPLLDDSDIQVHLPADKLKIENLDDSLPDIKRDTERIIKGYLSAVLEVSTIASWTTPELTPPEIRAIGGRLAAALIYRLRYSEDALDDPEFAQVKYNEAIKMLMDIINGTLVLTDPVTGDPLEDQGESFDSSYFEPNDTTDPPKFTMSGRY